MEDLSEFKAQRNDRYTDISRLDVESRMSKTFKDPCLLESPKSFKLLNSTVAGDNQYKSIPKKQKKPAAGYS